MILSNRQKDENERDMVEAFDKMSESMSLSEIKMEKIDNMV